ncbi:BRO1-like domain containing protein, putative [Trypanosoma equiperdum]|uniref:BRO1-like domain containing protein, putative n=1 Tax=Trypanosoma equiperdum TaxID=5694 RepID=A0A1G4IED4_TRYEQ|nr:BRO1-like domain containing protein, putative [Trypanosoma equiperdum]
MLLRFVTFALKESVGPSEKVDANWKSIPPNVKRSFELRRAECIAKFGWVRDQFKQSNNYATGFWKNFEEREKLINCVVDAVNDYAKELAALLYHYPVLADGYYYCWTPCLSPQETIYFDDFRYDLQNMYFNVGVILVNVSERLVCWQSAHGHASALQKECYHYLLQAAGYFCLAKDISDDMELYVVGDVRLARPGDVSASVLEFCHLVAIGQAQEIGSARSTENGQSEGKMLTVRLLHQTFKIYEEAHKVGLNCVAVDHNIFNEVLTFVKLKVDVFKSLTYSYASSGLFDSNPAAGLWFANQSDLLAANAITEKRTSGLQKKKLPFRGDELVDDCRIFVQRNIERCRKINSLVHRTNATEDSFELPPPTVLAQKKDIRLPAAFPHQTVARPTVKISIGV